jgi:adenine-specific DNA-methyltransferase
MNTLKAIPIAKSWESKKIDLAAVVDRILSAKQRDAGVAVSALEREIDELVYALYGLTPEEKALVQAAAK